MGWFRKKLDEEVNNLIKELGVSKEFLSKELIGYIRKLMVYIN